jgi:hypothetical protein
MLTTAHRAVGAAALVLLVAGGAAAGSRGDRLDQFRELAASRLGRAQLGDSDGPAEAYPDIYAVLDDEIVESLASGGPFASLPFIQDRLDTFAEAWGGATLRLSRAGSLFVGAFTLDERSAANSVRVYGRLRTEPALLSALYGPGRPTVHLLPSAADGAAVLVAWEGTASRWGTRPLLIELLRRDGDRMRVAWSTTDVFADDLLARSWAVRGGEVRIRYELRYPGWAPGCEGQTEQEDVYRVTTNVVTRLARRQVDGWHRELHAAVERLTAALAAGDERTVAALVPDRGLRARLPAALRSEPTCDARESGGAVSVAAVADGRQPWALTFRRLTAGWRLTDASRVLQ